MNVIGRISLLASDPQFSAVGGTVAGLVLFVAAIVGIGLALAFAIGCSPHGD